MGKGRPWEDRMAVDVALWFIFAAMIALIACGCIFTWPASQPSRGERDRFEDNFYRRT